jgi:hypothetical protein
MSRQTNDKIIALKECRLALLKSIPIMMAFHLVLFASLIILSFCEAGVPHARNDETTGAELDLKSILQVAFASPKQHRQTQQAPPCNEGVEALTLAQLSDRLSSTAIDASITPGGFENSFVKSSFISKLKYGIEVRRV